MKKLSHVQKILIFSGAAVLLVLICLISVFGSDPYTRITDEQLISMCRDAYDGLYQKEYLHFTQNLALKTPSADALATNEVWFNGDNFFLQETQENGDLRAFFIKDGTYYHNSQKELAPAEWKICTDDPIFSRTDGSWSDAGYTPDSLERNGQQLEVTFSRDGGLTKLEKYCRMHYLTFRFDRDLQLIAIRSANIVYGGDKADPNNIYRSQDSEYIFHDTQQAEIDAVIDAPFQIMEAYRADGEKWMSVAAAAYEELYARTLLHYTSNTTKQASENEQGYTFNEEGWICGTDSLTVSELVGANTLTRILLENGSAYCKKTIRSDEESDWSIKEREPDMHQGYQRKWPDDTYTFYSADASANGTDIVFYRITTSPGADYVVPGITVVTFRLDKRNTLWGITEEKIRDATNRSFFNSEPSSVTEYRLFDVTEADAQKEIDAYYKKATSGS